MVPNPFGVEEALEVLILEGLVFLLVEVVDAIEVERPPSLLFHDFSLASAPLLFGSTFLLLVFVLTLAVLLVLAFILRLVGLGLLGSILLRFF